jgi:hypothetical protein
MNTDFPHPSLRPDLPERGCLSRSGSDSSTTLENLKANLASTRCGWDSRAPFGLRLRRPVFIHPPQYPLWEKAIGLSLPQCCSESLSQYCYGGRVRG